MTEDKSDTGLTRSASTRSFVPQRGGPQALSFCQPHGHVTQTACVNVCMCTHTRICMHTCIYTHTHACARVCTCMCTCVYTCVHTHICMHTCSPLCRAVSLVGRMVSVRAGEHLTVEAPHPSSPPASSLFPSQGSVFTENPGAKPRAFTPVPSDVTGLFSASLAVVRETDVV